MTDYSDDDYSYQNLLNSHRTMKKKLQADIMALKKSAIPSEKKQIERKIKELTTALNQRIEDELAAYKEHNKNFTPITENDIENSYQSNIDNSYQYKELSGKSDGKITKAAKRREMKNSKMILLEQEREQLRNEIPSDTLEKNEITKFDKLCQNLGKEIYQVISDGSCLYAAISHQLSVFYKNTGKNLSPPSIDELRKLAGDQLESNAEHYLPFIEGCDFDIKKFINYCDRVRYTKLWGGHCELDALSKALSVRIAIYHCDGDLNIICPNSIIEGHSENVCIDQCSELPLLCLSYHNSMFSGAHYNSLVSVSI